MSRKICITENQYKMIIKEGILPDSQKIEVNAPVEKYNNNPEEALKDTQNRIKQAGGDLKKFNVSVDGNKLGSNQKLKNTKIVSNDTTNTSETTQNSELSEGMLLSKKKLQENRLKALKKNSELYTLKDFIKNQI